MSIEKLTNILKTKTLGKNKNIVFKSSKDIFYRENNGKFEISGFSLNLATRYTEDDVPKFKKKYRDIIDTEEILPFEIKPFVLKMLDDKNEC